MEGELASQRLRASSSICYQDHDSYTACGAEDGAS